MRTTLNEDYFYWRKIYWGDLPILPPPSDVFKTYRGDINDHLLIHIIYLKFPNFSYWRNPHAFELEKLLNTKFYGPLVVCTNLKAGPSFLLQNFSLADLDQIKDINKRKGSSKIKSPVTADQYVEPEIFESSDNENLDREDLSLNELK